MFEHFVDEVDFPSLGHLLLELMDVSQLQLLVLQTDLRGLPDESGNGLLDFRRVSSAE